MRKAIIIIMATIMILATIYAVYAPDLPAQAQELPTQASLTAQQATDVLNYARAHNIQAQSVRVFEHPSTSVKKVEITRDDGSKAILFTRNINEIIRR